MCWWGVSRALGAQGGGEALGKREEGRETDFFFEFLKLLVFRLAVLFHLALGLVLCVFDAFGAVCEGVFVSAVGLRRGGAQGGLG